MRPGDEVFAADAGAFDDAPAGGGEGGIDVFGAGFGFVHKLQAAGESLVEQRLFQFLQRGEFLPVNGLEALGFGGGRQIVRRFRFCLRDRRLEAEPVEHSHLDLLIIGKVAFTANANVGFTLR